MHLTVRTRRVVVSSLKSRGASSSVLPLAKIDAPARRGFMPVPCVHEDAAGAAACTCVAPLGDLENGVASSMWKSYGVSAALHLAIFLVGIIAFVQPPRFGVAAGEGGAAGASSLSAQIQWMPAPTPAPVQAPAPEPMPVAVQTPVPPTLAPAVKPTEMAIAKPLAPSPAVSPAPAVAKASAAPATHAPTVRRAAAASSGGASGGGSGSGARTVARPNYLRNPPPAYPAAARQRGQQGLVLLNVRVDARGRASAVHLDQSCGVACLDSAALSAVRRWQFYPATMGSIPIESSVVVPVRFRLSGAN